MIDVSERKKLFGKRKSTNQISGKLKTGIARKNLARQNQNELHNILDRNFDEAAKEAEENLNPSSASRGAAQKKLMLIEEFHAFLEIGSVGEEKRKQLELKQNSLAVDIRITVRLQAIFNVFINILFERQVRLEWR